MGEYHKGARRGGKMKGAGEAKRANHHLTRGQRVGSACVGAGGDRGAHELAPP